MISTTEIVYALQGWAAEGGIPERDAPVIRAFLTGLLGTEKGREHVYGALLAAQQWAWADASAATYARLHEIAEVILHAGFPVVIDATYLKREQRDGAAKIAEATGAPFLILDCNAPQAVIASWLAQRQADQNDPSDATLTIIEEQQANRDPLTAEELLLSKRVETNESGTLDALVAHIRQRLPGL